MSTFKLANIQDLSAANNSTPEQIAQGRAKVWVRFTTVTTTAITDSYGVSSLTDNGTADTTINFTSTQPNANYAVFATGVATAVNQGATASVHYTTAPTTSAVRVYTYNIGAGTVDLSIVSVAIFGD